jgi:hypothetical protein
MKLKTNELIGIILCAVGVFDLYIMPKILSKSSNIKKELLDKVIKYVKLGSYFIIGLGILIFLGIFDLQSR